MRETDLNFSIQMKISPNEIIVDIKLVHKYQQIILIILNHVPINNHCRITYMFLYIMLKSNKDIFNSKA